MSYAGVSDVPGMQRYDSGFLNGSTRRAMWKDAGDGLKQVSPINGAAEFSIPVLLMHGKQDLRVPVAQSREMADRLQFLTEMKAFLAQYNPAGTR